jgi:hypothetical protein
MGPSSLDVSGCAGVSFALAIPKNAPLATLADSQERTRRLRTRKERQNTPEPRKNQPGFIVLEMMTPSS